MVKTTGVGLFLYWFWFGLSVSLWGCALSSFDLVFLGLSWFAVFGFARLAGLFVVRFLCRGYLLSLSRSFSVLLGLVVS